MQTCCKVGGSVMLGWQSCAIYKGGNGAIYTPPRPSRFADQLGSAAGKKRAGVRQAAGSETRSRQQAERQRDREHAARQRHRVRQRDRQAARQAADRETARQS